MIMEVSLNHLSKSHDELKTQKLAFEAELVAVQSINKKLEQSVNELTTENLRLRRFIETMAMEEED